MKVRCENHAAKGNDQEMFRIQFKGDFFKIGKTKGIYDKTNKSFGEEMFPEQEDAGDKKMEERQSERRATDYIR